MPSYEFPVECTCIQLAHTPFPYRTWKTNRHTHIHLYISLSPGRPTATDRTGKRENYDISDCNRTFTTRDTHTHTPPGPRLKQIAAKHEQRPGDHRVSKSRVHYDPGQHPLHSFRKSRVEWFRLTSGIRNWPSAISHQKYAFQVTSQK